MATLMAWGPAGQESLGAIQIPMGTVLSNQRYWNLLGVRLKQMANRSSPQELQEASNLLIQASLLEQFLEPTQAAQMLLLENLPIKRRLIEMGVPGDLPDRILRSDPMAQMALDNVTLLDWVTELAAALVERD